MRKFVLLLIGFCLIACSSKHDEAASAFVGTDISGSTLGRDFELMDHHGQTRHLSDFRGHVVGLFFGYTHCPDVCPTTMADLSKALKLLGSHGKEVQVLFVTLDPARDTTETLANFVPSFDPTFIGLRGDEASTKKIAQDFKIFYAKQNSESKLGYTIDHSAGTYLFDRHGKVRVYMNYGARAQDIAHDVKILLEE